MDKEKAKAIIEEELGKAAVNEEFDRTALTDALKVFGVDVETFSAIESADQLKDFAAAIAYYVEGKKRFFNTAIAKATKHIVKGDYIFCPNISDESELGFARAETVGLELPECWEVFFDYEALGETILENTDGYITDYGFFMLTNNNTDEEYWELPDVEIY